MYAHWEDDGSYLEAIVTMLSMEEEQIASIRRRAYESVSAHSLDRERQHFEIFLKHLRNRIFSTDTDKPS